jgi:hypothetical protein
LARRGRRTNPVGLCVPAEEARYSCSYRLPPSASRGYRAEATLRPTIALLLQPQLGPEDAMVLYRESLTSLEPGAGTA